MVSVPIQEFVEDVTKPWQLPEQKVYTFFNATLINPVHGTSHANAIVKISKGRIDSVSYSDDTITGDWADSSHIDLKGKFICPGLIDCHIHLTSVPGESTLRETMLTPHEKSMFRQPYMCEKTLKRGFTTVRDCGGATLALKEAIEEGVVHGPRLFIAGHIISQTGGHGDARGSYEMESSCCAGKTNGLSRIADGVPECFHAARDELRGGADFIKITCSGGVASPTDKLTSIQYTVEEIRAIATTAHNSGTYVTAHAYTPASIKQAILAGVTGIEHGNLIDKETAQIMAANNIYLTPTLITYAVMSSHEFAHFLPPQNQAKNQEVLARGLESIRLAHEAGVTMLFGTDLLGPLTKCQTQEFVLRAKVLDAKTVLQSATINAAKRLGQEDFLGRIEEGFAADMLILNKNPLDDIGCLDNQEKCLLAVIKDGRVYDSRWSKLPIDVVREKKLIE